MKKGMTYVISIEIGYLKPGDILKNSGSDIEIMIMSFSKKDGSLFQYVIEKL